MTSKYPMSALDYKKTSALSTNSLGTFRLISFLSDRKSRLARQMRRRISGAPRIQKARVWWMASSAQTDMNDFEPHRHYAVYASTQVQMHGRKKTTGWLQNSLRPMATGNEVLGNEWGFGGRGGVPIYVVLHVY